MNQITRAFDAKVDDVAQEERTVVARVHSSSIDRYNSMIVTRGIRFDKYMGNDKVKGSRIVLHEHGRDSRIQGDPIGTCRWIRTNGGPDPTELIAKIRFLDDPFSIQRYEWYRDGVMNGFSIRCLPDMERCGPATREEIKKNPALARGRYIEWGGGDGVFVYRSGELLEVSTTSIPGNADCTTIPGFPERAAAILGLVERGLLWVPDEAISVYRSAARTMTESMGGLASGGATVIPENADTKKLEDDDEDEFADDYDEAKAKKRKRDKGKDKDDDDKAPDKDAGRSASHPSPVGFRIEPDDHGGFIVYDGPAPLVTYQDRALAERAIAAMGTSRTFADTMAEVTSAARVGSAFTEDINRWLKNELELRFSGSVGTER